MNIRAFCLGVLLLMAWDTMHAGQIPSVIRRNIKVAVSGGGDVTAPAVTISAPTSSATYDAGSTTPLTTLAGTASDAVGITSCSWANNLGGSGSTTGTTNWSVASIALTTGTNAITVTCVDAALNAGTDVLLVTYAPAVSGGAGCNGPCLIATSFLTSEGWTQDASQWKAGGTPCNSTTSVTFGSIDGTRQTGFSNGGASPASGGTQDQGCAIVFATANYAGGGGGRGYRHYRGGTIDNNTDGGLNVSFSGTNTEIWMAYRFRYASNYGVTPIYTKDAYWHSGGTILIHGYQGGGWGFNTTGSHNYGGSLNWAATWGGSTTADGTWHCFDAYHKISTSKATIWIDGNQVFDSSSITYSTFASFNDIEWGSNQTVVSTVTGQPPSYTDFDDLKIDNNLTAGQRIGCPGAGG